MCSNIKNAGLEVNTDLTGIDKMRRAHRRKKGCISLLLWKLRRKNGIKKDRS